MNSQTENIFEEFGKSPEVASMRDFGSVLATMKVFGMDVDFMIKKTLGQIEAENEAKQYELPD